MIDVSDDVMRAMGFEEYNPPILIQCKFFNLNVYSINGIHFETIDGDYIGHLNSHFSFGLGNDVNAICMKLINEEYCNDPAKWMEEKNAHTPFLITLTSNYQDYSSSCQWIRKCDDQLHTFNSFSRAKNDLDNLISSQEKPFIPAIIASLAVFNNFVTLKNVDSSKYGKTNDGKTLLDIRINVKATGIVSTNVSAENALNSILGKIRTYQPPINQFSNMFYSAIQETDNIKSFLFAWTALEILINSSFDHLSIKVFPEEEIPVEYLDRINKLFSDKERGRKLTSIMHKYAYLQVFKWKFLNLDDYDNFFNIKKVRDKFIHGNYIETLPTNQILLLTTKIIKFL